MAKDCARSLDAWDEQEAETEELLTVCPNGMGLAKNMEGLRKGVWEGGEGDGSYHQ